jgi:hypothetical protein
MFQQDKSKSFMQELDEWTEQYVIGPLVDPGFNDPDEEEDVTFARVKKAIRDKVLDSYRNGQQAGPRKPAPRRS